MTKIPYGTQDIDSTDIESVVQTLRSNFLTQGPQIENFESEIAKYCDVPFVVAVSNATAALHIACLASGLGKGKKLWTSANSFVASSNCGLYCDAQVDFVDIDPITWNMSLDKLEEKIQREGPPDVLVPVFFAGRSCDMEKIYQLKQKYNFTVIEDASHAIGGSHITKEKVGCSKYSDMTVFSFHPVKIITTGEGGAITTRNVELAKKIKLLRSHGITRNIEQMLNTSHGPWYYEQIDLGYNYRMTDIQAALGASQIKRLDQFVNRRREIVKGYRKAFDGLDVGLPEESYDDFSSWHLFVLQIDFEKIKKSKIDFFKFMHSKGIGVNLHYMPIPMQPYYQKLGFKVENFPAALAYYKNAVTIPMYPKMKDEDINYVVKTIKEAFI